jgi:hypothetical protein
VPSPMVTFVRGAGRCALICAAVVWMGGFGTLTVFYAAMPRQPRLPGLFDFLSATWGDGLALPLMAAALVYAALTLPPARRERVVAIISGLAGAAIGVATQVQWLRDNAPRPNWTFPRAHHFNVAGVYHAIFLVTMCAFTTALWLLIALRLAQATDVERSAIGAGGIAAGSGAVFVVLLALDGRSAAATRAGAATTAATAAGLILLPAALASAALIRWRRSRHRPRMP